MARKAEMMIGNKMIAGKYEEKRDKESGQWRWRFSYDNPDTRHAGTHVFGGFSRKEDLLTNAKIMGVEF